MDKMDNSQRRLEERITFCEQTADALSGVVFELQKRVEQLELRNRQLIEEVRRLRESQRDPFSPEAEKPPHY